LLKNKKTLKFALLTTILLFTIVNAGILSVQAQNTATLTILDSVGGTTTPAAGTTTPEPGTVTLSANPEDGYVFLYWVIDSAAGPIVDTDNPATLEVAASVTYTVQAVFQPENIGTLPYVPPANTTADAIVVILSAVGGTTTPAPGIYGLASAAQLQLTAIPDNGWIFVNWIISGFPIEGAHGGFPFTATPTNNPYSVSHGEGNTYNYQPVFVPTGTGPTPTPTATPTPTPAPGISTDMGIIIALVVVLVIVLIAFGAFAYSKRSK
jgi:hypothetical protein